MTSRLWPVLLLLAAPLMAQDEELAPTADATNPSDVFNDACATGCDSADCFEEINEDPDGAADDLVVATVTQSATIIFDFGTPASNVSTGASAQNFDYTMSRCDDDANCTERGLGNNPTFNLDVYCGGTLDHNVVTGEAITTEDEAKATAWTFSTGGAATCATDGSDMQVRFTLIRAGGGGNRNYACIENFEWEVTWAAAADELMVIGNKETTEPDIGGGDTG